MMNDAAVLGANGLDRFGYHPPGLVGRLGQVAIHPQMLPCADAKIRAEPGIFLRPTVCVVGLAGIACGGQPQGYRRRDGFVGIHHANKLVAHRLRSG